MGSPQWHRVFCGAEKGRFEGEQIVIVSPCCQVDRLLDIPPMLEEMGRLDTVPGRAEVLEDKIKMCTFLEYVHFCLGQ